MYGVYLKSNYLSPGRHHNRKGNNGNVPLIGFCVCVGFQVQFLIIKIGRLTCMINSFCVPAQIRDMCVSEYRKWRIPMVTLMVGLGSGLTGLRVCGSV